MVVQLPKLLRRLVRQKRKSFRFFGSAFSECNNKDPTNSRKRAMLFIPWDAKPVCPSSKREKKQRNYHCNARDTKTKNPTDIILNIVQDGDSDKETCSKGKIPPIEKGASRPAFLWVVDIKLISSKCLNARLMSTLCKCKKI